MLLQGRLIVFHYEKIIAATFCNRAADILLGENRISRNNRVRQFYFFQQVQRGLDLVGLGLHPDLSQHAAHRVRKSGQQMDAGIILSAAGAQGLAVDGHGVLLAMIRRAAYPPPQRALQCRYVQPLENIVISCMTGGLFAGDAELGELAAREFAPPARDGGQTVAPGHGCADGDGEN